MPAPQKKKLINVNGTEYIQSTDGVTYCFDNQKDCYKLETSLILSAKRGGSSIKVAATLLGFSNSTASGVHREWWYEQKKHPINSFSVA